LNGRTRSALVVSDDNDSTRARLRMANPSQRSDVIAVMDVIDAIDQPALTRAAP
jgi:hypothetical protein